MVLQMAHSRHDDAEGMDRIPIPTKLLMPGIAEASDQACRRPVNQPCQGYETPVTSMPSTGSVELAPWTSSHPSWAETWADTPHLPSTREDRMVDEACGPELRAFHSEPRAPYEHRGPGAVSAADRGMNFQSCPPTMERKRSDGWTPCRSALPGAVPLDARREPARQPLAAPDAGQQLERASAGQAGGQAVRHHHRGAMVQEAQELSKDEALEQHASFKASQKAINSVIHAHSAKGDFKMAESWLGWMHGSGLQPSGVSYACVINACAQAGNLPRAEEWIQEMVAQGFVPSEHSYNSVINACAKAGDVARAEEWMEYLTQSGGFQPNVITYNTVIHAHAVAGDVRRCECWLLQMLSSKLLPNEVTMASVINACAEAGDVKKAERWLQVMQDTESWPEPNEFSYHAVIKACVNTGNLEKVEYWVDRMLLSGFAMTSRTYNLVIHACAQVGDIVKAESKVLEMEKAGCQPDRITYNSIINTCATRGDDRRADMWVKRMVSQGIQPDQITMGSLCKALARKGKYAAIQQVISELPKQGLRPNKYFFASLISACATAKPPQPMIAEGAFLQCLQAGLKTEPLIGVLRRAVGRSRVAQLCETYNVSHETGVQRDKRNRTGVAQGGGRW